MSCTIGARPWTDTARQRARAREEVEHEKHDGLRGTEDSTSWEAPCAPTEPEAQGPAVTGAYVAAEAPHLVVASLSVRRRR